MRGFDFFSKWLKHRKEREWNLKFRDAWGHSSLPENENVQDMNYTVSWDKEFNEAVLRQLREIPNEYRRIWREEQERSTKERRALWKKKREEVESRYS
jgi:hypothetical protein